MLINPPSGASLPVEALWGHCGNGPKLPGFEAPFSNCEWRIDRLHSPFTRSCSRESSTVWDLIPSSTCNTDLTYGGGIAEQGPGESACCSGYWWIAFFITPWVQRMPLLALIQESVYYIGGFLSVIKRVKVFWCRNYRMKIMIRIIISSIFLLSSFSVSALTCKPESGPIDEIEDIGRVIVPSNAANGSRLWTSKEITRNVLCESRGVKEYVYFYGNPDNAPVRQGIGMGIVYNGRDLGIVQYGSKIKTDIFVDGVNPTRGTVKFQVYLQKTGVIGAGTSYRSIAVFQLDGVGGINIQPNSNYRYSAGGIDNIKVSSCSVDISVPSEINFGSVSWDKAGQVVSSRDLIVSAIKSNNCKDTDNIGVDLIFDPIGQIENGDKHLNLDNGSVLRLMDGTTPVKFRAPVRFWDDVAQSNTHVRTYRAEILTTGAPLTGEYSRSLMVYVNYF